MDFDKKIQLMTDIVSGNEIDIAIRKYELGYPCMFGEAVVRIVGESGQGSWGKINGKDMYSIPNVATPHGTVLIVGLLYLRDITEEGMKKLKEYEQQVIEKGDVPYNGLLKEFQIK